MFSVILDPSPKHVVWDSPCSVGVQHLLQHAQCCVVFFFSKWTNEWPKSKCNITYVSITYVSQLFGKLTYLEQNRKGPESEQRKCPGL